MIKLKQIFIIIFLNSLFIICSLREINEHPILLSTCPIYITISSLAQHIADSHIEINWGPGCDNPPEWLGLYNENPSLTNKSPIVYIDTEQKTYGSIRTNVTLGKNFKLPNYWYNKIVTKNNVKPECLPYYVASFIDSKLIAMDCLKIQPNWMSSNENIHDIQLKNLFIPGTHCSGCYYNRTSHHNPILRNYGIAQNFDIWTQLIFGVRYFDFHIGYSKGNKEHFWITNENIFIQPFINVIKYIKKFLKITDEIIILDINKFPIGFYKHDNNHIEFIEFLTREFNDLVYQRKDNVNSYDLTINDFRKVKKNIIILYNVNESIIKNETIVWPSWQRHSSESLKLDEINEYMRNLFRQQSLNNTSISNIESKFGWIFLAIQGIESSLVTHEKILSIRERANNTNRKVATLIGGPWSLKANIVALDFIMSSNIINIAVHVNRNKFYQHFKNYTNFELI